MKENHDNIAGSVKEQSGCMTCGASLLYTSTEKTLTCVYCKNEFSSNAVCGNGHFVCDICHSKDALSVIKNICLKTEETDMVGLFEAIREHPAVPVNGPEHHIMVPAIILATYRNQGGNITSDSIQIGISRGARVPGGHCGFMGVCGAAIGVGIAFSLILDANPLKPVERKIIQQVTQLVLTEIAKHEAARCCQRDSWVALTTAETLSEKYLPVKLNADKPLTCRQQSKNKECMKEGCPLWPGKKNGISKT